MTPGANMARQKDSNAHRAGKRSFQANLKPAENELVERVKTIRGVTTDRELLVTLCEDELDRQRKRKK
jgi:hypothetical protein